MTSKTQTAYSSLSPASRTAAHYDTRQHQLANVGSLSGMSSSSDNQLAFTGHIANTLDALLIFEGAAISKTITSFRVFVLKELTGGLSLRNLQHADEGYFQEHRTDYQRSNVRRSSRETSMYSERKRARSSGVSEFEIRKTEQGLIHQMRRWTDGRRWSPSRIMNNFLIYRSVTFLTDLITPN